jgi:hypothetical protein
VNAVANILLSHRLNLVRLTYVLLLFPNSWPKNVGAAYARPNTVIRFATAWLYLQ